MQEREQEERHVLPAVNTCVFVLDQLVNTANEDIAISCDVSRRNISPLYIRPFVRFPIATEICEENDEHQPSTSDAPLRLVLGRFSRHITNAILSFHISTMSDFDFQTYDGGERKIDVPFSSFVLPLISLVNFTRWASFNGRR